MATILLPLDFKEFLSLFESHGVEYLLVGGYAVIYHGYVRTTGDMDVWIAVNPENAKRVGAALQEFGFSAASAKPEIFLEKGPMTRMGRSPVRIEILTDVSGLDFTQSFSRRTRAVIDGVQVNVIQLEDLIANKKASGRFKDLADAEKLDEALRKQRRKD